MVCNVFHWVREQVSSLTSPLTHSLPFSLSLTHSLFLFFSLFMFFVSLPLKNCFPLRDRETSLSSRPPLYYCCPSSSRLLFHTHAATSPMKLIFKEHPSIKFFQSARSARLSLIPSDVTRFAFFFVFLFPFDARVIFSIFSTFTCLQMMTAGQKCEYSMRENATSNGNVQYSVSC